MTRKVNCVESISFDRAAGYYDATRSLPPEPMRQLTDLLAGQLASRQPCLDIGTGTGRLALPLRQRGITMLGTDLSGAMLRRLVVNARGAAPPPLLQADAAALPLAAGTVGSVLAVHVLHLIPLWRLAVDEAVRVLRPGGALIASFGTDRRPVTDGTCGQPADPGPFGWAQASAPWAAALRETARRHGLDRRPAGPRDPAEVARYLGPRATAAELDPVPFRSVTTLSQTLDALERQLFSWTWAYPPERMAAAAGEVRAWASRRGMPLDTAHEAQSATRVWVFQRPRGA